MAALRKGYTTTTDIAKLTALRSDSVRQALGRLCRAGKVRIVGTKHAPVLKGRIIPPRNVYAIVE